MPRHIDELIAKYGGSPSSKSKRKVDRARHVGERVQGQDCSAEGIAIKQHREAAARRGVAKEPMKIPIDLETMAEALSIVKHAVSEDETRPQLNSVLIEGLSGRLAATASDGMRLSHVELPCDRVPRDGFLIPQEFIGKVMEMENHDRVGSLMVSPDAEINSRNKTQVVHGQISLSCSRGIVTFDSKGHFPPWEEVIPPSHDIEVHADIEEMIGMLKQIPVIENIHQAGRRKHREVLFVFSPLLGGRKTMSVLGITQSTRLIDSSSVVFLGQFPYDRSLSYNAATGMTVDLDGNFVMEALRAFRKGGAASTTMKFIEGMKGAVMDPVRIDSTGRGGTDMIEVFQPYSTELASGMLEQLPYYCEHAASGL